MTSGELAHHALTWRRSLQRRETILAAGVSLIVVSIALILARQSHPWVVASLAAVVAFIATLAIRLAIVRPSTIDAAQLARHLNRANPELEESSALWLRPIESLSVVERLQRARLDKELARLSLGEESPAAPPADTLRVATAWLSAGALLAALAAAWVLFHALPPTASESSSAASLAANSANATPQSPAGAPPKLERAELIIRPPVYTQHPERTETSLNAEVEEGSVLTWRLAVQGDVRDVSLRFGDGGRDVLPMQAIGNGRFEATRAIADSELYALTATLRDGNPWTPLEIYALKTIKDQPPTLRFVEPALSRTEIPNSATGDARRVQVRVLGVDDYGLAEAHLVATVAKGSGEAVKFREQIIEFDPPSNAGLRPAPTREFSQSLDLTSLGLEPGDELYFYVTARDNRQPTPNRARSETRFIVLKGPHGKASSPGRGVSGVNLVPPYFRSQRQLIIDTEKLVADRSTLSDTAFRERSNELGIDQQLLRLRYGQFLGEELEEGFGPRANTEPGGAGPTDASGVPLELMHQHDRGAEGANANAARETAAPAKPATGIPPAPDEIISPFVDQHDSQDQATFFDRPTKSSLRAALGAMWEAEGMLRTTRPAEALPAENRALEILKALQQSARAYVQRVGFEAAPLKIDERRLKGDLAAVARLERALDTPVRADVTDDVVRDALRIVSWGRTKGELSAMEIETLRRAEPRLMDAATRDPAGALAGLQALRRLTAGITDASNELPPLERALWKLLPAARALPTRMNESSPALSDTYFQLLEGEGSKP